MCGCQVIDAALSECMFNMLEGCVPEVAYHAYDRPPSGSTISGAWAPKKILGVLLTAKHAIKSAYSKGFLDAQLLGCLSRTVPQSVCIRSSHAA